MSLDCGRLAVLLLLFAASLLTLADARTAAKNRMVTINILHVNDVHDRKEPTTASGTYCNMASDEQGICFGGYARMASIVKSERRKDRETLFIDAGDQFTGTVWDTIYKSNETALLQNMLRPDVMVLGNHEFDFGSATAAQYVKQLDFPMLGACNIDFSNSTYLKGAVRPYHVKTIKGKKIAFVGAITPDTQYISNVNDRERLYDPVPGLSTCILALYKRFERLEGVILVSHLGYAEDLRIAQQVPGIDLIIGGHTHTLLWNGPTPLKNASNPTSNDTNVGGPYPTYVTSVVNPRIKVPVVTAYYASFYMGHLKLAIGGGQPSAVTYAQPILLGGGQSSNNVPKDPEVDAAVQALAGPVVALSSKIVGSTLVPLNQATVRTAETNLGNLVCEAALDNIKTETTFESTFGKVDICLWNGGGIRAPIPAGNVTNGQVTTVLPFGNTLAVLSIKGSDLILALANGVSGYTFPPPSSPGRFPQVTGLRFVFNSARAPASPNNAAAALPRLVSVKVTSPDGFVDIDPCKMYNVVTNNYMAAGGDAYFTLATSDVLLPTGAPADIVLSNYFAKYSPVNPQLDGRIVNCDLDASHPACTTPEAFPTTC